MAGVDGRNPGGDRGSLRGPTARSAGRRRAGAGATGYGMISPSPQRSNLDALADEMYALMVRNVASDGFVIEDPLRRGSFSRPGCIIASPSFPGDLATVDQDYVFNWVRDAAIAAIELTAATVTDQPLDDYVTFARACQLAGPPTLGHACFTVEAAPRPSSEQNDGPALQVIAILGCYARLNPGVRATAREVIDADVDYLLSIYREPTTSLWEEHSGGSFFARAVILRCLREVASSSIGIARPGGLAAAVDWLTGALAEHWNATSSQYVSLLPAPWGYDPNIDVVLGAIYGNLAPEDPRLLATAATLRRQWSDPALPLAFPINRSDADHGLGPLLGRYPGDSYDGDTAAPVSGGHPWALSTCAFAELLYRLALTIAQGTPVPADPLAAGFLGELEIDATTPPAEAIGALLKAGDRMLGAVVLHSDHLELSEQFDATTGFEKSVRNLTWSYASFLSATRARRIARSVSRAGAGR
jgi:glucoamylase